MPEFTDYQNLELPEPFNVNERDEWGRILNDALDTIDDKLILSGPLTARPPAQTQGRLFLDNGSGTLYRDNGSSWQRFGSQTDIQESQSTASVNPNTINFNRGFTVTEPSFRTAKVEIEDIFIENSGDSMEGTLDLNSNDLVDGAQAIWDASIGEIPDSALGTIENATLGNDSLTISAGDGLKSGGSVSLGGSTTIDIEPADFAGDGLSDDGSDNLAVSTSDGVTTDSGALILDETFAANWTTQQTFAGGIDASSSQITNLPEPIGDTDAARKQYVDGVAQGLDLKDSCAAANATNIDLSSATDPNPIDGHTVTDGERVLLKSQTDATENGIYIANTATDPTTWARSADADEDSEITNGTFVFVENGTVNGSNSFIITTNDPITLGTTAIQWSQFSTAGEITGGDGLTKSGNTLNIEPADFAGAFLSDDGSDNLQVNLGTGVESDGGDGIRLDEDYAASWTSDQTFGGDILDDSSNTIYDGTNNWVPSAALEADSLTVTAGNQLTGGGSVSLGGSVTLNIDEGDGSGLDADTVDGFEAADIRASSNALQLSSNNTTLDINQSTWTDIPFNVQQIVDSAFSHDASSSPEIVTFDEGGKYRVYVSLSFDSTGAARVNPAIKFNINGTRLDTTGASGYIRHSDGHDEASNSVSRIVDVNAGDTLKVQTLEFGDSGEVLLRANESVLTIEQLSASASPISDADTLDGLDSTAFVKTDGSAPFTGKPSIELSNNQSIIDFDNLTSGETWDFAIYGDNDFAFRKDNTNVFEVNNSTLQVTFPNRVTGSSGFDAGGSTVDNVSEANTTGGGSSSFDVYDSANGQNIARFNEGGNVAIPNGSLSVSDVAGSDFVAESGDTMVGDLVVNSQIRESNNNGLQFSEFTADGSGSSTNWNVAYNTKFESNNNALSIFVSGTQNERIAGIQSGHKDNGFADAIGVMELNPFGGAVRANGNDVLTTADSSGFVSTSGDTMFGNLNVQGNSIQTNNFEVVENSSTNSLDFNYTGP